MSWLLPMLSAWTTNKMPCSFLYHVAAVGFYDTATSASLRANASSSSPADSSRRRQSRSRQGREEGDTCCRDVLQGVGPLRQRGGAGHVFGPPCPTERCSTRSTPIPRRSTL